jgi:indole-3-glycerol phosphate synthase
MAVMFLDNIVEHVREEIQFRRRHAPPAALRDRPLYGLPRRGFLEGLKGGSLVCAPADRRRIIAEVKRASPSQGLIRAEFEPANLAKDFAAHGAAALSVLTEGRFFGGSLLDLERVRNEVTLPLLRKDFTLDSYQLLEARGFGADAVLLIAALLEPVLLRDLIEEAHSLSLDALVEIHTESELERALGAGAFLIGINNRDLRTFEVRLETTERLAPLIPKGMMVASESGIHSAEQIRKFEDLGVHIFLIGEALMRAPRPGEKLKELLS